MPLHDDDWFPLPPEEHERQMLALTRALSPLPTRSVIDLGAGSGRVAIPLARTGARVLAVDSDPAAIEICNAEGVATRRADLLDPGLDLSPGGPFDAALCLGHTLMLIHRPPDAVRMLRAAQRALKPGGLFITDNFPGPVWAEVAEGNWQEGVSADGAMQMVWAAGDNVIALRRGPGVRPHDGTIRNDDRLLRLWSLGELALLAEAAGFTGPVEDQPGGALLIMRARNA